ncbi:MAG TPA: (2Fe-2S) ferredoxin domain-containing protein, partial [Chloroflexia bacterium]|nr:(2Fe-2S) ferredoxin domain-containing protein [Chloroflexia bacterium]
MSTPARWRAYICCGPNCTQRRSPGLIDVMQREVDRAGLAADVEVLPGGCQKHCERGPSLVIWPGPIYYEQVDPSRLRRIVREQLGAGCPIREWFYQEEIPQRDLRPRYPSPPPAPP